MKLVKFLSEHFDMIDIQPDQRQGLEKLKTPEQLDFLSSYTESYTVLVDDKVIFCGGLWQIMDNVGRSWAVLAKDAGKHLFELIALIKAYHSEKLRSINRIETVVLREFTKAAKWMSLLGYEKETNNLGLRNYGFAGETYDMYAIVSNEN